MKKTALILLLPLIFVMCKTHRTNLLPEYKKMKDISELNIAFRTSRLQLEKLINDFAPDVLFDDDIEEDVSFHLTVHKRDITNIELAGQKISASLVLDITATKDALLTEVTATGSIMLDISTYLDVDENWHILSNTSLEGYRWIEKPVVKVAMFKFSPVKALEKLIEYKKEEWMATIDDFIYENDFVERKVDSLLLTLQQPYPMDSFNVTGLLVKPLSVSFAPFYTDMDSIFGRMQLQADMDIVLLNKTEQAVANLKKPSFNWDYNENNSRKRSVFAIKLNKRKLQQITGAYLDSLPDSEKTFEVKGKKLKLDSMKIDIIQGNIDIVTYFSGDSKGILRISTYPQWDYKHKKIKLTDVHTDIKTEGFGTKIILSLFKNKIKKKVTKETEDYLNEMIKYIVDAINARIYDEKSNVKLKISDYDIPVGIEDEELLLNIILDITGTVKVKNLEVQL